MWLYPLLILSAISLFVRIRLPWRWSWGFIIQALPLIACGVLGLTIGPDWMYAIIGWALVFLLYVPPKVFYTDLQRYLTAMDAESLRRAGKNITLLFWGLPGEFWKDMTFALSYFVERKADEAETLLAKWQGRSGLPKSVAQIPNSYRLIGRGIMWQWDDIIAAYEKIKSDGGTPGALLPSSARAYAETGQFSTSVACFNDAKLVDANLPLNNLALQLLPFFSLIGATMQTEALVSILSHNKKDFPEFSRLYWIGRCHLANGEFEQAKVALQQARENAQSKLFQNRVDAQLDLVERREPSAASQLAPEEKCALVDGLWKGFSRAAFVQEIISPRRKSIAVISIIGILIALFIVTDMWHVAKLFDPHKTSSFAIITDSVANSIMSTCALDPKAALSGQYWRFFTYLFLHANETHIALNVIGLYWFGRVAENIFGTTRFLAIYIVGGLLSGVVHALLSPDQIAVGASGAIMAMFGAVGAGIYRLKDKIPDSIRKFQLSWLGGLALAQVVLDQLIPHVAAFAHLGGMVSGFAIGMLLSIRTPSLTEVDGTQKFVGG
jgi:membrane associated rhomboid family serine protease